MEVREPDFSGWATKSDIKCSDGRIIKAHAFAHQDKTEVPLVWQHQRKDPKNILGKAILEDRAFGVYTHGYFDETPMAHQVKGMVKSGKINALSIYASKLAQSGDYVKHGLIEEVSLVRRGANPGAFIDNVNLAHGNGVDPIESEAIIYTGLTLEHQDSTQEGDTKVADTETKEKTVQEIFDELTKEQKDVVYFMIGQAIEEADDDDTEVIEDTEEVDIEHSMSKDEFLAHIDESIQKGITEMAKSRNVFEDNDQKPGSTLSHADFSNFVEEARKSNTSLKEVLEHADYGIDDIELLFPDAKALSSSPDFISRRMEWVNIVLTGTKHSPFAKVKTIHADITAEEARARGYIKGKMKKEEVIKLLRRTTSPATIYKKQKLDRDDILDITDFDVVLWLRAEMRLMLEEEIARAILVGDGRDALSDDKVKDPEGAIQGEGIRSILHDSELYAHKVQLPANTAPKDTVKGLVRARTHYRGSGKPTLFISDNALTDIMLEEDKLGRALYASEQELADKIRVDKIVTVDLFDETEDLMAIMVNLADYTIGANKGGEIANFEDFDIDFNQKKYLIETRISGALTKPKSAIVIKRAQGTSVIPTTPDFDQETNILTIPTKTGVEYLVDSVVVTGTVTVTEDTEVMAHATEGYFIPAGTTTSWTFHFQQG